MKKILFVASSLSIGGMERVLVDIANSLVGDHYDVSIITYAESARENFIGELDKRISFVYKPPRVFSFRKKMPYIHRYYRPDKWETRCSPRALYRYYVDKKVKYDVEIAFCRGPAVKIISGSSNKQSKKYTWVHNDYRLVDPKTITKYFGDFDLAKKAYEKFDRIIAVSDEARRSFVETIGYPEKTSTIYNMVDVEQINRKSLVPSPRNKNCFTVISVARLIDAKGYETLLRAVKRLNDEHLQFELWLVGSGNNGPCELRLRKYAEDNNLTNVVFLGRQLNPYVFMKQADVYICSSWREGFSISVAEALACGLPVISTSCTGPTEILDNGKYGILIHYDEDEMFEALRNAILNPASLTAYREKSLRRANDFSSEVIIKQIETLFE